jgi:hypothetical protein
VFVKFITIIIIIIIIICFFSPSPTYPHNDFNFFIRQKIPFCMWHECHISLCNNRIRAAGERALASVIRHHNRTLLSLDLSGCKRAAAGVALTEAALAKGCTLATLAGIPILAIKTGVMTEVNSRPRPRGAGGWGAGTDLCYVIICQYEHTQNTHQTNNNKQR